MEEFVFSPYHWGDGRGTSRTVPRGQKLFDESAVLRGYFEVPVGTDLNQASTGRTGL